MDKLFKKFYNEVYIRTGGFFPSSPIGQNVYPGDFFQIKDGEIIVLGNIFRKSIVDADTVKFAYDIKLNPADWIFSGGVSKPYSGRGKGDDPIGGAFEFSKEILAFKEKGSYFFKGEDPLAVKIMNWAEIWQQLIIKLTQTFYSFREIYVVTECATMANWTLAISDSDKGELEIASDSEDFGLIDIFGEASAKTVQAKDIGYYDRHSTRSPTFFKAKKLAVQNDKVEPFISQIINERLHKGEWADNFFECDFDTESNNFAPNVSNDFQLEMLSMLQANELNPNTALQYFRWEDASLDDIEKFF